MIYTHSHVDHFGGVLGVTTQADVDAGKVAVLAPEGFTEHAVQENVYAGTAMARRAAYMYGAVLDRGPQGQVGCGLGQTPSTGEVAIIVPTVDIRETGETHTIDGVEIEFQMAPGTEAPAEMHFYFPRYRALCMAENATHNLHNLLTLRGALVRDPHGWAGYLTEAIDTFADRADVVFASHHWPTWGKDRIVEFLSLQRDMYAYLHDQTLRQLNQGFTGIEIAENFAMPPALEKAWHAHGYYGSVSHNVKAVYQRYMGWFDGNPGRLWPHPPEAIGPRYVEAMGGMDSVVEIAQDGLRLMVTSVGRQHFWTTRSSPTRITQGARELYADTLEQLAYGAENATWRNFFLAGATELRDGNFGTPTQTTSTVDGAPAVAGADVRRARDQRERAAAHGISTSPSTSRSSTPGPTTGWRCATACWCTARWPPTARRRSATMRLANKVRLLTWRRATTRRRAWRSPATPMCCRHRWRCWTGRIRTSTSSRRDCRPDLNLRSNFARVTPAQLRNAAVHPDGSSRW